MTASVVATGEIRTPSEIRRARVLGVIYFVLAGFVLIVFGFGSEGTAIFELTRDTDRFSGFPDLHLPALGFAWFVAFIFVMLGTVQLLRGFGMNDRFGPVMRPFARRYLDYIKYPDDMAARVRQP